MKRRTFISLVGVTAAFCFPSIVKARQKLLAEEVAESAFATNPPLQRDVPEEQFDSDWNFVIKVVGVGGAGGKAIEHMIRQRVHGVEFIVADTDARALKRSSAETLIQLGQTGRSSRAAAEIGFSAAMENRKRIAECLQGAHMVFIVAGMGGGTGMGAAPVFAEVARELGILTVGLVTLPFGFEGKRVTNASTGIASLQAHIDSLILVPNDKLIGVLGDDASMDEVFNEVHEVLLQAVSGITEIFLVQELVNVDFEDVRTVMGDMGLGMMGLATATGVDRARIAAQNAIASPLLEGVDLAGAQGLLVTITAQRGLKMREINEVMNVVRDAAGEYAPIVFGTSYDEDLGDDLRVTLVATGYVGGQA
jgi:cell division protein FtsZ